jgi:hypothetical protein
MSGVRVSVPVVDTGADQRDLRADRSEERRVGGRRAVVRDGEELHLEQLRPSQTLGQLEQVRLCGRLDVTGEERTSALPRGEDDEGAVVELAAGPAVGAPRRRREHLEVEVPDDRPVPRRRPADRHLPVMGRLQQRGDLG